MRKIGIECFPVIIILSPCASVQAIDREAKGKNHIFLFIKVCKTEKEKNGGMNKSFNLGKFID